METALTSTDLYARFQTLTAELLEVPADLVVPEASFADDLGADSLDLVELVETLEQAFGVHISDDDLADVTTVGEAFALLTSRQ
jgi:acyl carrier protein